MIAPDTSHLVNMSNREPMFNVSEKAPLYLCGALLLIHIVVSLPFSPAKLLSDYGTLFYLRGQFSEPYTVLSHGFFHVDYGHVIMNSFMILIFGIAACRGAGTGWRKNARFIAVFLGSIIIGGLAQWIWWAVTNGSGAAVGASGGASGLFAAMAWVTGGKNRLVQFGLLWAIIQAAIVFSETVGIAQFSTAVAAHMGGYFGGALLSVMMLKPSSTSFMLGR